ncbi:zeta toxin [Grosmannia clavigera kw1407]|uniref:Zeta toxin n=1 Tax=Grosmannia clavigera (strain kw1407 / UAMH 11150) TaxID=655863 RepID=F0XGW6_GROCL|nr:zeta toxin [Grosmannia clavigera kw1407]EFX03201.1 zeta toxin [Grosmannia clavigera kw1407]
MSKPSDYYLSDEENAAIFERLIRPAEFGPLFSGSDSAAANGPRLDAEFSASSRPVCILLAGQTGAGKSHTAPVLAAALRESPASGLPLCHLVADTHKPYHPAYAGLVAAAATGQGPPGLASAATGHDARRWLTRACAVAAERRCDVLVESASRFPQDVAQMARTFRRAGYRVCLVMMAVHVAQSRLGLLARYLDADPQKELESEQQVDGGKPSLGRRLTPRKIHDESYAGLAQLAVWLDSGEGGRDRDGDSEDDGPLADAVIILRRGNKVVYANYWGENCGEATQKPSWRISPPHIGQTLAAERQRCDVPAEAALFASDVARLSALHPGREAELSLLASVYLPADARKTRDEDNNEMADVNVALIVRKCRDW